MSDLAVDFKEQVTEARRTQILMGAAQVFAKKGFHRATTKEIARAAGVAEGTIYNYFDSKRELLLAMIQTLATQTLQNAIQDNPPDDPKVFLRMVMLDRVNLAQSHGQIIAPLLAEVFSDAVLREEIYHRIAMPLAALVENYIERQIAAGVFRPVNPVVVTRALMGAMMINIGILLTGMDERYEEISPQTLVDELVSLVINGLLT